MQLVDQDGFLRRSSAEPSDGSSISILRRAWRICECLPAAGFMHWEWGGRSSTPFRSTINSEFAFVLLKEMLTTLRSLIIIERGVR
jgi:hypothetical protein